VRKWRVAREEVDGRQLKIERRRKRKIEEEFSVVAWRTRGEDEVGK
jgi:hypothetical protein